MKGIKYITRYKVKYKNGQMEAGTVKNSEHKQNSIFLRAEKDGHYYRMELTKREVLNLTLCLIYTLSEEGNEYNKQGNIIKRP